MEQNYLYVMISHTDTGMGRIIRTLSGYVYNHVSITLDPSLRMWYSFARHHYDCALYSGYIQEPVERFLAKTGDAQVRIFRLPISKERAERIGQLFLEAGKPDTKLIYNYYDATAAVFGQKIAIRGAYTCLSFACAVLERQFRDIEKLNAALADNLYYDGSLAAIVPDSGSREDAYFQRIGFVRGNLISAKQMAVVTGRFLRHRFGDLVDQKLHSPAN